MDKRKMKKLLILNLPYFLVGLFATNLGEAWRLAEGADSSAKILSFFHALPIALNNPFPSFHPLDLLIGILCGAGLRLAVYLKGKNAKKYRHNVEYGSARWGTAKDIEPFIAPKFEDNVILTKTERLKLHIWQRKTQTVALWEYGGLCLIFLAHLNRGKMALAKACIWQEWNVLIMQKHLMDGQNG